MADRHPAPKAGRFPLSSAVLLVGAGVAFTVALLGAALALDPEEDAAAFDLGYGALGGLLFLALVWAGTRRARRTYGWSGPSAALLAAGLVVATALVLLVGST